MKTSVKLTAVVLTAGLMAGCAGPGQRTGGDYLLCSAIGAVVGGAAGAATSDGAAAAGGAIAGAALATLLCPSESKAEPVEAQPVCAQTPPVGALLDANGCAYDTDKDGVVAGIDLCRNTPAGVTVDNVGCPIDSDKDAVADYKDRCPDTASGTIVDQDGCPIPGQQLLSLTGVNFGYDKATLTPESKEILGQAVTLIKKTKATIEVRVEGHTDSRGPAQYNLKLSQKRAEAVVAYLVSQGVDSNRLVPVGMGETSPVADNSTKAGRAANRRVDFVVKQ